MAALGGRLEVRAVFLEEIVKILSAGQTADVDRKNHRQNGVIWLAGPRSHTEERDERRQRLLGCFFRQEVTTG